VHIYTTTLHPILLTVQEISRIRMLQLTNLQSPRRHFLCVALVLLAVCMLAVRVATRYCSSGSSSSSRTITLQKQAVSQSGLQRITKGAPAWMPPVVRTTALQAPSFYPRIAPSGPPLPGLIFEKSLYNRPPPAC
jgi:hypothetical protein